MSDHSEPDYSTPEATALATRELCKANPKAFAGALSDHVDLFAAIVRHHRKHAPWLNGLQEDLRVSGLTYDAARQFRSTVDREAKAQEKQERATGATFHTVGPDEPPPLVKMILGPDAPVHGEATVPAGFVLRPDRGLFIVRPNREGETQAYPVAPVAPLITRRFIDAETGDELCNMAWLRDGQYKHSPPVKRSQIASRTEIVKLSDKGLPVNSGNAADLVAWLAEYETINQPYIPVGAVSSHLGWQGPRADQEFLCGRRLITTSGVDVGEIAPGQQEIPPGMTSLPIAFHGRGEGDAELADGICATGTLAGWKETIKPIAPYPRVRFMLYASLAAPLLRIFGLDTFFVDMAGLTSTGKTTSLRIAASPWGQPNPSLPGSMVGSWDASPTYIERRAALFNGIPVLLDDSKQASDPDFVARMIYNLASGQGRGRGNPDGMRRSERWRTTVLSTGEQSLIDFTQDGGTRGRVITQWGSPFGPPTRETALLVSRLMAGLERDHGHAGPAFVAYVQQHRDEWDAWRQEWSDEARRYAADDADNPIMGRLSNFLAAISMAAMIAHDAQITPWGEYEDPIAPILEEIREQGGSADRAEAALHEVATWASANEQGFYGRHINDAVGNPKQPSGGWLGRWEAESLSSRWASIAIVPEHLEAFLKKRGFDKSVVTIWRDRGYLETDSGERRNTKRVRLSGSDTAPRCVVIKREALEQ